MAEAIEKIMLHGRISTVLESFEFEVPEPRRLKPKQARHTKIISSKITNGFQWRVFAPDLSTETSMSGSGTRYGAVF